MHDNSFIDEARAPDPASIEAALGGANPWYLGILEAAAGFELEWKHYGKKYGWKLKAHDGEKTLFELTVTAGQFRIGMAVREAELKALRDGPATADGLAELVAAERAREGWGIRLLVGDEKAYAQARALVGAVAGIRRSG